MTRFRLILVLLIICLAMALRTVRLAQRPMHTDEAVHAAKFGSLLETNQYQYDPFEYHGPTLNYFTLIPAWLDGERTLAEVSEYTLRLVPALFGVLLLLSYGLVAKELTWPAMLLAGLFTAISPAMVFYSRYYIQEMLLVCFSSVALLAAWRFLTTGRRTDALFTGLAMGLMHATKETAIIALAAIVASATIIALIDKKKFAAVRNRNGVLAFALLLLVALSVSALFYSSFGAHPAGIADSFKTLQNYFHRAAGLQQRHLHPWYYYLQLLTCTHPTGRLWWSEAGILLFSLYALYLSLFKRQVPRLLLYLGLYGLLLGLIYSSLAYKTPWSLLGFFQPMMVLAGFGAAHLLRSLQSKALRTSSVIFLCVILGHLLWQTLLQNFKYECDPVNPYVYGHTSRDIYQIVDRIRDLARVHPQAEEAFIEIVCTDGDYWPLPWYLRAYPHVGYWSQVDFTAPLSAIIAATPDQEQAMLQKVYEVPPPGERNLYVPMFDGYVELRPGVELRGYTTKELWDRLQEQKP